MRIALTALSFVLGCNIAAAQTASAGPAGPVPTAERLQQLLDEENFIEFAHELPLVAGLKPEQKLYFDGMLAYRQGRLEDARKALIPAVNAQDTALTHTQVYEGLDTLADNAERQYDYGASANLLDLIDKVYGPKMAGGDEIIKQKRHFGAVLQHVPPQTVSAAGDFSLKPAVSGSDNLYPVEIGGKTVNAVFDTGAEFSVMSATTATGLGVQLLEGTVTMHGYIGGTFPARPAAIPVLKIGGEELHNVVVMVTADENLYIAPVKHQIDAVIGYPVLSALGRLTFAKDGTLTVSAHSPASEAGAEIWLGANSQEVSLDTMAVMKDGKLTGSTGARLFMIDTGSGNTYFTDRYLTEHKNVFNGPPKETAKLVGAGGSGIREIPAYGTRGLPLWFGPTLVLLNGPHILTQPQGGEAEHFYGLIGQDTLRQFSSYTLDFRTMRVTVVP